MATVGFVYDDRFCNHNTGNGHPERPDRLRAIMTGLRTSGLIESLMPLAFTPADDEPILRVHDAAYLARLTKACESNEPYIDAPDSAICTVSETIARLAAGGILAATDSVLTGDVDRAFCALRPPGHHAERDRSMGFCLFNNIAVAAEHAIAVHGLKRVAIVDFDVHHGNGTQHSFESRDDVLFISLHQNPRTLYPGTGFPEEKGTGAGEGYTLNLSMAPGSTDAIYEAAFKEVVLPRLEKFAPELMLISAGFDAAAEDPLADMELTEGAFGNMTSVLCDIANRHCDGKVVSTLEGGYDLQALSNGVQQHVRALLK